MSLTELDRQALGHIENGLAGSDPRLASMLTIFSRLAAGEEMPAREKIRVRRGRPAAHRPRRARRHLGRGTALPQPRRRYARLGQQQAMLLWAVISAGLLTVALALNTSGHNTSCIRPVRTACSSPLSGSGPGNQANEFDKLTGVSCTSATTCTAVGSSASGAFAEAK